MTKKEVKNLNYGDIVIAEKITYLFLSSSNSLTFVSVIDLINGKKSIQYAAYIKTFSRQIIEKHCT